MIAVPLRLPYFTLDQKPFFAKTCPFDTKNGRSLTRFRTTVDSTSGLSSKKRRGLLTLINPFPLRAEVTRSVAGFSALGLPIGPYFLFCGALEPKKTCLDLLRLTYSGLDLPLLVVGREGWLCGEEVRRLRTAWRQPPRVFWLRYLPRWQVDGLMRHALALVMPPYEGFGLPIIEAMAQGTPVITSDRGQCGKCQEMRRCSLTPLTSRPQPGASSHRPGLLLRDTLSWLGRGRARAFSPMVHSVQLELAYSGASSQNYDAGRPCF